MVLPRPFRRTRHISSGLLLLCSLAPVTTAAAQGPFEERPLRVEGRPLLAFPIRIGEPASGGTPKGHDLGVIVIVGAPPDETRHVTLFTTRSGSMSSRTVAIPPEVVAVDVADVDPGGGDELILVSARKLLIVPSAGDGAGRSVTLDPPLPLPPRARDLSLLGTTRDWDGSGEPTILLPTPEGVRAVGLRSGTARPLAMPILAEYETFDPTTTARDSFFYAGLAWPSLSAGRDDADPRRDLFALSRYGIHVFRPGADGLPGTPSRSMKLRPFSPEEELRPRATQIQQLARDLDGDGLTDLVLHRTFGTLQRSEDRTEVHRNTGNGADANAPPEARIPPQSGIGILDAVDLDGDGRLELVEARVGFGIVQILRLLTTRRAQVELRVNRVDGPGIRGLSRSWSDTISIGLDFEQGRPEGLFPTVDGDWNGDGRRDLLLGLSGREIGILLGGTGEAGPGFSSTTIRQEAPATGRALVADLDGDGLDDLTVHDPRDVKGTVHWLRNRGTLRGAVPELPTVPATKEPPP